MYFYQFVSIWLSCAYYVSVNTVIYSMMTLTNYHVKLLGYRLRNFGHVKGESKQMQYRHIIEFIEMHVEIKRYEFSVLESTNSIQTNHLSVYSCVQEFMDIFNTYLLIQVIKSIFLISIIILQLMTVNTNIYNQI